MRLSSIAWAGSLIAAIGLVGVVSDATAQQKFDRDASLSPLVEQLTGVVAPESKVVLRAPLEGVLEAVNVEEGDRVQAGQVVAKMEDDVQQAAVAAAKLKASSDLAVKEARLRLEEAKVLLELAIEAHKKGGVGQSKVRRKRLQVNLAQVALKQAKLQRKRAKQALALEKARLDRYDLEAPFDGLVTRVHTEAGATLTQQDKILTLVALDPLEAEFNLPIALYGKLELGQTYRLKADAPVNRVLEGKLTVIEPIINSASRTFRAVFTIQNDQRKLPAGFDVRLIWPQ